MGKSKKVKGTKQTLEYVEEEKKLYVKSLKCKTKKQKEFIKTIEEKEITICVGPAGVGKGYCALSQAMKDIANGKYKQLVLVKPTVSIEDSEIGFIPGDVMQKMEPFIVSYTGNLAKILGDEEQVKTLMKNKTIVVQPLTFIRGITIDDSIVICDEFQNVSLNTFKSMITRIGENSKYIIMGDVQQCDLGKKKDKSCLQSILDLFKDKDYVGTVEFTEEDCVRNHIIPKILKDLQSIEK